MPTVSQLQVAGKATTEKVIVWELEMSYSQFRQEQGGGEFAAFLKAEHVKDFPLTLTLLRVDEQELPQTGRSLVARFSFDAKAKAQLTAEYVKSLDKVEAKDIGFPLNATNGKRLADMFGDAYSKWHGTVQFKTASVTNPKTKEEVDVLRVIPKGKAK